MSCKLCGGNESHSIKECGDQCVWNSKVLVIFILASIIIGVVGAIYP